MELRCKPLHHIKATEVKEARGGAQDALECGCHKLTALAQWKAGFIEDAYELHLAPKPVFASVIQAWAKCAMVSRQFEEHAPGGREHLDHILRLTSAAVERAAAKRRATAARALARM